MKTLKSLRLLLVLFLISTLTTIAQKIPDYQYKFDGQVKWMMLHESGTLLASTGAALIGIRPNSEKIAFKFEGLKKIKEENLELVPGTPYLIIKPKSMMGLGHATVVDVVTGKIVFDSKKENWKNGVASRFIIQPEMMIVVSGMHKEKGMGQYKQGVGMYDLKTGELVRIFERKPSNTMVGKPDILEGNIMIPGAKNVQSYNIETGAVNWKTEAKNVTGIITFDETKEMYAYRSKGDNTVVYKVDASNGKLMWKDGNKLKGVVGQYEFTPKGLAIVTNILPSKQKGGIGAIGGKLKGSGTSKIYFLDKNTGKDLWAKSPKTKGLVTHFYIEEDGVLFGTSAGGINKIDFNGTPRWKKPYKTGPRIQIMARVDKGLLYISETDADLIDFKTGKSVFGKPIKYKKSEVVSSTYDRERDLFLISCKEGVYEVNANSGDYELIAKKLDFEGKEIPNAIEIRKDGILLSSDQNMMLLDFEGKEMWHTYHRAPGRSAAGVALLGALTLASGAMAASESYAAGSMRGAGVSSYNSQLGARETNADNLGGIAGTSFKAMVQRFNATKATKDASFILTKVDGGISLVKVDKDSGDTLETILIKDKDPLYEVDEIEGILYFKSKGNTINAYKLTN